MASPLGRGVLEADHNFECLCVGSFDYIIDHRPNIPVYNIMDHRPDIFLVSHHLRSSEKFDQMPEFFQPPAKGLACQPSFSVLPYTCVLSPKTKD